MRHLVTPDRKVVILNDDGRWKYATPSGSIVEKWRSLQLPSNVIGLFKGLFEKVGVQVIDTDEAFTCIHRGDRIEFAPGVDEGSVDFTVQIYAFQLDRLAQQVAQGAIDELEQFRIARQLFTRSSTGRGNILSNPLMSNSVLRRMIRGKNLIHVYLVSPDPQQEPDATFTLIYINRRWLVIAGLYGEPGRVFRISVADALELQRRLVAGITAGKLSDWLKIAKWYIEWRKKVEVPI